MLTSLFYTFVTAAAIAAVSYAFVECLNYFSLRAEAKKAYERAAKAAINNIANSDGAFHVNASIFDSDGDKLGDIEFTADDVDVKSGYIYDIA